jgi:hypothetical protein
VIDGTVYVIIVGFTKLRHALGAREKSFVTPCFQAFMEERASRCHTQPDMYHCGALQSASVTFQKGSRRIEDDCGQISPLLLFLLLSSAIFSET